MVSVCLPSNALLQHLPSYLGFSYLGRGVSLHGCSSKLQPLLLTLDEGYLLTAALPGLHGGMAPLGPPAPVQPPLIGRGVALPGCCPWPRMQGSSSWPSCNPAAMAPWTWGRILPRKRTGHSKHYLPTTQEKTLNMDITDGQYRNQTHYILCSPR